MKNSIFAGTGRTSKSITWCRLSSLFLFRLYAKPSSWPWSPSRTSYRLIIRGRADTWQTKCYFHVKKSKFTGPGRTRTRINVAALKILQYLRTVFNKQQRHSLYILIMVKWNCTWTGRETKTQTEQLLMFLFIPMYWTIRKRQDALWEQGVFQMDPRVAICFL